MPEGNDSQTAQLTKSDTNWGFVSPAQIVNVIGFKAICWFDSRSGQNIAQICPMGLFKNHVKFIKTFFPYQWLKCIFCDGNFNVVIDMCFSVDLYFGL